MNKIRWWNKQASISQTMMWMVAGFIILFILLVFILFTFGLVLKKNIPFIGDKDLVTLNSQGNYNLEGQRILFLILDFYADSNGEKIKFSDLILSLDFDSENNKAKLKTEGEKIIKNIKGEKCYSLGLKRASKEIGIGEFDKVVNFVPIFSENLYLDDSKTEINLYERDC